MNKTDIPTLEQIKDNASKLTPYIRKTPVLPWEGALKDQLVGSETDIIFKCELFQKTGTFKLRGALTRVLSLTDEEKKKGIVAGTGENPGAIMRH